MRPKELIAIAVVFVGVVAYAFAQDAGVSYARDIEPIFVAACGDCHGSENPKKGLDLSQGHGRGNMLDKQSQEVKEVALLKAGDPAASYLWVKLTHTNTEGRGMPRTIFSSKKLPQAQLDLVERWIKEGAKP
jgi:mono/diheme cytochrome c family protein